MYEVQAVFQIIYIFKKTGKTFIQLFEFSADGAFSQIHFTDLDYLDWFRDMTHSVNFGICKYDS